MFFFQALKLQKGKDKEFKISLMATEMYPDILKQNLYNTNNSNINNKAKALNIPDKHVVFKHRAESCIPR